MTDRDSYASKAIASAELSSGAAIVLEHFGPASGFSINAYGEEGELVGYANSVDRRAQILALGRAIVEALDPVLDPPQGEPEPEPATVELVGDPTLPLDVEIRTIALDAAVRAIGDSGDDVVTHARAIERFLVGGAEEAAPAPVPAPWPAHRFEARTERGGRHVVYDLELDRVAPFGRDDYALSAVTRKAQEWNINPDASVTWGWC